MLHVYYLLCHVTCHVITHSPICNKISIRFDPDREGDEIHESGCMNQVDNVFTALISFDMRIVS